MTNFLKYRPDIRKKIAKRVQEFSGPLYFIVPYMLIAFVVEEEFDLILSTEDIDDLLEEEV
jgi:hypothetical protein